MRPQLAEVLDLAASLRADRDAAIDKIQRVREALARHDAAFSHSVSLEAVQESRGRFLREVRAVVEL